MSGLAWAAGALAAYGAASAALARSHRPAPPDRLHEAVSADGRRLEVAEYGPGGRRGTVYLQHGLGGRRSNFDLHPHGPSLARWLAGRGWRVLAGSLRGRGEDRGLPRSFSDYLLRDLPALGDFAGSVAGGRFHALGHSLGGILLLGWTAREGRGRLHSLTTVASALNYGVGGNVYRLLGRLRALLSVSPRYPTVLLHRLLGPLSAAWVLPDPIHYRRGNMSAGAALAFHAHGNCDITRAEMSELATTLDGQGILCRGLGLRLPEVARELDAPWLCLAGTADPQCPPDTARWTFERVAAPRKEIVVAGLEGGLPRDYGHLDLVCGRRAEIDVWPRIESFMASCAPAPLHSAGEIS